VTDTEHNRLAVWAIQLRTQASAIMEGVSIVHPTVRDAVTNIRTIADDMESASKASPSSPVSPSVITPTSVSVTEHSGADTRSRRRRNR
jgi:hypothetical protein